jgi:hypothetical protein
LSALLISFIEETPRNRASAPSSSPAGLIMHSSNHFNPRTPSMQTTRIEVEVGSGPIGSARADVSGYLLIDRLWVATTVKCGRVHNAGFPRPLFVPPSNALPRLRGVGPASSSASLHPVFSVLIRAEGVCSNSTTPPIVGNWTARTAQLCAGVSRVHNFVGSASHEIANITHRIEVAITGLWKPWVHLPGGARRGALQASNSGQRHPSRRSSPWSRGALTRQRLLTQAPSLSMEIQTRGKARYLPTSRKLLRAPTNQPGYRRAGLCPTNGAAGHSPTSTSQPNRSNSRPTSSTTTGRASMARSAPNLIGASPGRIGAAEHLAPRRPSSPLCPILTPRAPSANTTRR